MSANRREQALAIRQDAARLANSREHEEHMANEDERSYFAENGTDLSYIASYTKGLPHNRQTGLVISPRHFELFVSAVESGTERDIRRVPLGPQTGDAELFGSGIAARINGRNAVSVRAWESMGAGLVFDLEGPDAQALTMPPHPTLESDELAAEMTEIYWMALLRDVRFTNFDSSQLVGEAITSLNKTAWVRAAEDSLILIEDPKSKRLRGRFDVNDVFRGNLVGDNVGPYISQFLLIGNTGIGDIQKLSDGYIEYGSIRVDQRVRQARAKLDYMTTWEAFLDVQNGADVTGRDTFEEGTEAYRFITTPRDLATYVHFDALYQAYLNACLIMLGMKINFDGGIPFQGDDAVDKQQGFAHWGGPHILTLVTEVATRALKAVRFQKFNTHRRLRPEAIGGLIERFRHDSDNAVFAGVKPLFDALDQDMLNRVSNHNRRQNQGSDFGNPRANDFNPAGSGMLDTMLLPMAFPEGSPMHPAYGAGHATVAGACVTVLKAFFDHKAELDFCFVPNNPGSQLRNIHKDTDTKLTVEGELNKVCSNISIGRNWGGVHYFTDYRESIELGERIALGILEEQMLTFPEDSSMQVPLSMTVPLFNGREEAIVRRNGVEVVSRHDKRNN